MKKKICVWLLTMLLMAAAVPVMAAESDTSDTSTSNYQQSEDGCKDGVCPWRKGGK